MAEKDQVKPLASVTYQLRSDDDRFLSPQAKFRQKHKYIKCCGCFAALLLILVVVGIILGFTIFHIKNPDIRIDSLSLPKGTSSSDGVVILVASVSVKNPNVASFKYARTTTKIYYDSVVIGEGKAPPGEAKARRTMKMNVTVEIEREKIREFPSLVKDFSAGALNISSYTEVPGRVKIIGFIKEDLIVKMNCSMTYNSKSQMIQGEDCYQRVERSD